MQNGPKAIWPVANVTSLPLEKHLLPIPTLLNDGKPELLSTNPTWIPSIPLDQRDIPTIQYQIAPFFCIESVLSRYSLIQQVQF